MAGFIRKTAAVFAALLITVSAAACDKKKEEEHDHDHNMAGINAPDGDYSSAAETVLRPDNSDVPITITYCKEYASGEEAAKVAEFYYALSEKNTEYLEKAVYPDVLSYKLDGSSAQEYLNVEYDYIKDNLTESDFKFTAVTIDDDLTSDDICSAYDSLLAKAAPDAKPESRKVFRANCLYEKGDGGQLSLSARLREKGMEEIQVAVYTIDGKPYIIF